jgi:hypothetical protein
MAAAARGRRGGDEDEDEAEDGDGDDEAAGEGAECGAEADEGADEGDSDGERAAAGGAPPPLATGARVLDFCCSDEVLQQRLDDCRAILDRVRRRLAAAEVAAGRAGGDNSERR